MGYLVVLIVLASVMAVMSSHPSDLYAHKWLHRAWCYAACLVSNELSRLRDGSPVMSRCNSSKKN